MAALPTSLHSVTRIGREAPGGKALAHHTSTMHHSKVRSPSSRPLQLDDTDMAPCS